MTDAWGDGVYDAWAGYAPDPGHMGHTGPAVERYAAGYRSMMTTTVTYTEPTCPLCGIESSAGCRCADGHPPEPTIGDYCAADGHVYVGDDAGVGRCYCGARTYPAGSPPGG
jgi:hypothetical protein